MVVNDPKPSINPNDGNDSSGLVGECVYLFREWVEPVLIGHNAQGHQLFVGGALERCVLERIQ